MSDDEDDDELAVSVFVSGNFTVPRPLIDDGVDGDVDDEPLLVVGVNVDDKRDGKKPRVDRMHISSSSCISTPRKARKPNISAESSGLM